MNRPLWLCLFLLAAAIDTRCAAKRFGVDTYLHALQLEVRLDRGQARVGEEIVAQYVLRNAGPHLVEGCLGDAKGYNMLGTRACLGGGGVTVDHPSCVQRFRLEPGHTLEWNEP